MSSVYLIRRDNTSYTNLTSVFVDGYYAWVLDISGTIRQFRVSDGSFINTIVLSMNDATCIFSDNTYLWVTNNKGGSVSRVNKNSMTPNTFPFNNKNPQTIVSDGTFAWFADSSNSTVTKINASTGAFINDVSGTFNSPNCITFDQENIYVANGNNSYVTVVSKTNDASFSQIQGRTNGENCVGITKDADNLFLGTNRYSGGISKVTLSNSQITNIQIPEQAPSTIIVCTSLSSFNNSHLFTNSLSVLYNVFIINQTNPLTNSVEYSRYINCNQYWPYLTDRNNSISTTTDNSNATVWMALHNVSATFGILYPPTLTSVTPGNRILTIDWSHLPPYTTGISYGIYAAYGTQGNTPTYVPCNTSPFTITGLTSDTSYDVFISVKSIGGLEQGQANSTTLSARTPPSFPDPPVINSVVPGNSQLMVTFSAPNDDGGTPITYYSYSIDGGTTKVSVGPNVIPFTITGLTNGTTYYVTMYAYNAIGESLPSKSVPGTPNIVVCFKADTKIYTDKGYRPIQDLRKGDLVKTATGKFIPIFAIGTRDMYHPASTERIPEQLYLCSQDQFPEVFEDLVITGHHAILKPSFENKEEEEKTKEIYDGKICITEYFYRIPACVESRTKVYDIPGFYPIYHVALENNNYYMNYGINANGLWVETCSKRYLLELSGMNLIG